MKTLTLCTHHLLFRLKWTRNVHNCGLLWSGWVRIKWTTLGVIRHWLWLFWLRLHLRVLFHICSIANLLILNRCFIEVRKGTRGCAATTRRTFKEANL